MEHMPKKQTHSRLSFIPLTTFIDPIFWNEVSRLKVNEWKLDESPRKVFATYTIHGAHPSDGLLCLEQDSLNEQTDDSHKNRLGSYHVNGTILLLNTKKAFAEELDRREYLEESAKSIWNIISSKEWLTNPDLLNSFFLTAWADIKNFSYFFWNCVPALVFPDNIHKIEVITRISGEQHKIAFEYFKNGARQPFLLANDQQPTNLTELTSLESPDKFLLVFPNSSSVKMQLGWTLRNLLAAIAHLRQDWTSLRVFALSRQCETSFIVNISWNSVCEIMDRVPRCVGWERDSKDKMTFRSVNLKSMFDPIKIMEQSVDLNLKLIRWRQAPSIDLDRFTSLRVLMVGSGTLGCNISRALLGWGVRNFTFIDHANVSYNNPIRQTLFTFDDCSQGEIGKAEAAANALKRIYPLVEARGRQMKIPMPGYPYSAEGEQRVREECKSLENCIRECDALFLVMDSRESRWLPTLLAAVHNKLAITVALGFDDFVIIRHGANPSEPVDVPTTCPTGLGEIRRGIEIPGTQLGCYFCNDVTAPGNSTGDRALDQQCTISRSGISMIASGFATELLASIIQHKVGAEAPARIAEVDESSSLLGGTPHQIRGFLSRFHQMMPTVRRFDRCTACGQTVRELYRSEGFAFLDRVFRNPTELEQITGLTELQRQANEFQSEIFEMEENESIGSNA